MLLVSKSTLGKWSVLDWSNIRYIKFYTRNLHMPYVNVYTGSFESGLIQYGLKREYTCLVGRTQTKQTLFKYCPLYLPNRVNDHNNPNSSYKFFRFQHF